MATALASLGHISRAVTILPKVPDCWVLYIAAMRTKTVICPGKLTVSSFERLLN